MNEVKVLTVSFNFRIFSSKRAVCLRIIRSCTRQLPKALELLLGVKFAIEICCCCEGGVGSEDQARLRKAPLSYPHSVG